MSLPHRVTLPYRADGSRLFGALRRRTGAVFLDSGKPYSQRGRFDILSAEPEIIYSFPSDGYRNNLKSIIEIEAAVQAALERYTDHPELPFCGGAIGCLGYDLGEALGLGTAADDTSTLPQAYVGLYPWAVVVDHQLQRCELVAQAFVDTDKLETLVACLEDASNDERPAFSLTSGFGSHTDLPAYRRAFARAQAYITAGDCYQINLSREFSAGYQGDPWGAYLSLRRQAGAPFSCYYNLPGGQLLCTSPERFLSVDRGHIASQPIKGTAARDPDPLRDQALAEALLASEKNRAENVMIVDLIRNDLSKHCRPGSVRADILCELQTFETVHHLVSTVSGVLKTDSSPLRALLDAFPGGSITGAPKRRAMEIIRELEPHRRGLYCGSVFYLGANGRLDSNITIRSFLCEGNRIRGFAGGGIVADSVMEDEFQETETKLGKLMAALTVGG